jgi:SAM-dependent methyltransferase
MTNNFYSFPRRVVGKLKRITSATLDRIFPNRKKYDHAYAFFEGKRKIEGQLRNQHYEYFYTEFFGLSVDYFAGKSILDIGCGPRGSLEWASNAARKVGLDPLVKRYKKLGIEKHSMEYVVGTAEKIPFADCEFNVITVFNALDHVEHLEKSLHEIGRVLKTDGDFLLIVELNHLPTITEPVTLPTDFIESLVPAFTLVSKRKFEIGDHNIYRQLRENNVYDEANSVDRPIIVAAHLRKPAS